MPDGMEKRAALSTGVSLAYVEVGRAGVGVPVVCLPGWPDTWYSFRLVLDALPVDMWAFSLTHRGCGSSDRPLAGYSPSDLAADSVAFLDAVGVDSAVLLGHSLGSFVALQVAIDHPERVRGLALIGAFATLADTPAVVELAKVVATLVDPIDPAFARDVTDGAMAGPVPADFVDTVVAECLKAPAFVWRAGLAGLLDADHTAHLGEIRGPTRLLWGDQDAITPRDRQDALVAGIPGAQLVVYPGVGHSPNWEEPVQVARECAEISKFY